MMQIDDPQPPGPLNSHPVMAPPPTNAFASAQRPTAKRANSTQRANSRFVEGSMNDRTSAAPPPNFLGPEDSTEIARRFRMDFYVEAPDAGVLSPPKPQHHKSSQSLLSSQNHHQQQQHPSVNQPTVTYGEVKRPASSASSHVAKKGFWGGLREKLSFVRDKDRGAKRPLSLDGKLLATGGGAGGFGSANAVPAPTLANGAGMPSREEIMASYQQLMKDGFFDAHAIRSTRQPPPPNIAPSSTMYSTKPPVDKKSFAERMSGQWPLPPTQDEVEPLPDSRDGNRKRGFGFEDEEEMSAVKKLRKSASRISVDLSLPGLRKPRSHMHSHSESMAPPPPPNYAAPPPPPNYMPPPPPRSGVFVRRSFSNSARASNKLAKHAPSASYSGPMDTDFAPPNPLYAASTRSSIDSNDSRRSFVESARAWTSRGIRRAAEPLGLRPNSNHGVPSVPCVPEQYKSHGGFGFEGENHNSIPVQERELPGRWRGMRLT
ncbi:unnamed protein product [Colletotrichum noveboracense]|uniref:Uncharacterized protein n=2 Tax=Colletotrichum gloeosporioides species complex TaxID=2707338 RepID=A0A9W4S0F9_9PEZI|nr:hypothetical protein K456DRAFT_1010777 [Colletotrichum gloeosporioides 23]KAJ0288338.1 hypothetical protein COL940_002125 [Colletotrichum noveboracense]KAJ0294678.1 hypothetical protein CBS470a_000587 [Colletotrichum nupharicola]CAI0650691.1 unnamed protein product [Colletotrichum noveboracense]